VGAAAVGYVLARNGMATTFFGRDVTPFQKGAYMCAVS
jgi:hypothetical protein